MFWTWMEDLPDVDMEATFAAMHEAGIDGVMLHAASEEDYKRDIEIAKKYGITVYAWIWTLNPQRQDRPRMLEEVPHWFDVNREANSVADHKAYVN
jgi:sugar phosphate isomerase/epimerase